jgi:hypothetical protein
MNREEPIKSFPLYWPPQWSRTPSNKIRNARFGDRSVRTARRYLEDEVRKMGGRNLIISSNIVLRNDGLPRSGQRQPDDRGVSIFFDWNGKPFAIACDNYTTVEDNLWALYRTISALRQIERDGSSKLFEAAFRGFAALPAPQQSEPWWEVLGVSRETDFETLKSVYRRLARETHPDMPKGSQEAFQRIQMAYEQAQEEKENTN